MRTLILAAALAAPTTAIADEFWPDYSTGWQYALSEPAGPGRERYGVVDAEPTGRAEWRVRVECGVRSTRDGKTLSRAVGTGSSGRGAWPGFGGQWTWEGGRKGGSFVVTQYRRTPELLTLPGEFTAPECPRRGTGALSSGD